MLKMFGPEQPFWGTAVRMHTTLGSRGLKGQGWCGERRGGPWEPTFVGSAQHANMIPPIHQGGRGPGPGLGLPGMEKELRKGQFPSKLPSCLFYFLFAVLLDFCLSKDNVMIPSTF